MIGTDPRVPMQTFWYSIIYLMALFVVMLLDHYIFPRPLALIVSP